MAFNDFLEKTFKFIKESTEEIIKKSSDDFASYSEEELLEKLNQPFTGVKDKLAIAMCLQNSHGYTTESLKKYMN